MKAIKYKHLRFQDRLFIQDRLDSASSFTTISKALGKDRTTIAREVKKNRFVMSNGNRPVKGTCPKIENKAPFVCNGCEKMGYCSLKKYRYDAAIAHNNYRHVLKDCRVGYRISKDEISSINEVISPLMINNHHSVYQVYMNHKELLPFSRTTFYRYVDLNLLNVRNIDLPRKVRFKLKKKIEEEPRVKTDPKVKLGRFFDDFKDYMENYSDASIVEMDTVIGTQGGKGGKCLLTLLFRKCKLMLIYPLPYKKPIHVIHALDNIKSILGKDEFSKWFEVILTDNGSEFLDPSRIECDPNNGEKLVNLFYCDPHRSWQKGMLEKNHEFIRYVLPKGTSFAGLSEDDCILLANHINSIPRDSLNGKTPYQLAELLMPKENLDKLHLISIPPDEVCLAPKLLKK